MAPAPRIQSNQLRDASKDALEEKRMRTTKRTITQALMAAVVAAAGAGLAYAHGPGREHRRGMGFGPGGHDFAARLGLSEQQQAQVKAIREKNREALEPLMDDTRRAHEAFREALEAGNADATTVGQAALAMRAAQEKLHNAHKAVFEQIKAVLTPEQLAKLEQERGRRHGPHHEGPGEEGSAP
jgi:Spy/CpxP family protein refolding chaperone